MLKVITLIWSSIWLWTRVIICKPYLKLATIHWGKASNQDWEIPWNSALTPLTSSHNFRAAVSSKAGQEITMHSMRPLVQTRGASCFWKTIIPRITTWWGRIWQRMNGCWRPARVEVQIEVTLMLIQGWILLYAIKYSCLVIVIFNFEILWLSVL